MALFNDSNTIRQKIWQLSFICLQLHIIVVHVDLHTVDTQGVVNVSVLLKCIPT